MKQILMISSEAVPYIKTGGLADVAGSMPKYVNKSEYDIRVMLPKYACMNQKFLPELQFVCHFYVDLNWRRQYAGVLKQNIRGLHIISLIMNIILQEIIHITPSTKM